MAIEGQSVGVVDRVCCQSGGAASLKTAQFYTHHGNPKTKSPGFARGSKWLKVGSIYIR